MKSVAIANLIFLFFRAVGASSVSIYTNPITGMNYHIIPQDKMGGDYCVAIRDDSNTVIGCLGEAVGASVANPFDCSNGYTATKPYV